MIEQLGIHYTDRCNIECAHCCVSSGPRRKTKQDPDFVQKVIAQAAELGIPAIKFTGGEALLYPKEIQHLTRFATQCGMDVGLVTNGYWARTPEKGRRFLALLMDAGLHEMDISIDRWHWEFLDPEKVGYAISAARELPELKLVLYRVLSRHESPDEPDFFARYGLSIDELRFQYTDTNDLIRSERAGTDPRTLVRSTQVGRIGRAQSLPENQFRSVPSQAVLGLNCTEVAQAPVLYPDGTLYACCSGKVPSPLHAGNLYKQTLGSLAKSIEENPLYEVLSRFGPKRIRDAIDQEAYQLSAECDSLCGLCKDVLSNVDSETLQNTAKAELFQDFLIPLLPTTPSEPS